MSGDEEFKNSSVLISNIADIVNEFGGDAPHALSEYYGGGGLP